MKLMTRSRNGNGETISIEVGTAANITRAYQHDGCEEADRRIWFLISGAFCSRVRVARQNLPGFRHALKGLSQSSTIHSSQRIRSRTHCGSRKQDTCSINKVNEVSAGIGKGVHCAALLWKFATEASGAVGCKTTEVQVKY